MLWTAFILGLFGGMHCAGMCGPIALSIPKKNGVFSNLAHKGLYNSGRVVTYSFLGVLSGLIGQGFNMAGLQQGLSISLGVLLITVILFSGSSNLNIPLIGPVISFTRLIKKYFSFFLERSSHWSAFGLGMINGFLPCGLVYIALTASIAGGSLKSGALYMMVFGLGTFPVMLFISLAGNSIGPGLRQKVYKLVPVFIVTLGLLFILRGLNLGIPYISPQISGSEGQMSNP